MRQVQRNVVQRGGVLATAMSAACSSAPAMVLAILFATGLFGVTTLGESFVAAQEPAVANPPGADQPAAEPAGPPKPAELSQQQAQIAEKFKRFEQVVKLLAQFSDETNGDQARLLRQVFAESQSRSLDAKFDGLVKALGERRLAQAVTEQEELTSQLETLLAILSSVEREKELKAEQARLREYLKKVKELINKQREVQGRTVQGDPKEQAADEGKLAEETAKLAERMAQNGAKPSDAKPGEAKPGEAKPGDAKPGDAKPGDAKPGDAKPGDAKPGDAKPGDAKPGQGKPGEGKPSDSQSPPSDSQSPTDSPQKRVAAAQQRMEEARKKLDEAKREGAVEQQDEAIRELEQARAELEEILRQLREEELARLLAQLEQRFAEMLRMQEAVYRDTLVLHDVPKPSRGKAEEIESGRLSRDETLILVEADRALDLLREEGSAVALPATCQQMREDIAQIVTLLAGTHVDELTIGIEEDVIAALKDVLDALKKAQKDLKDKKNPPPSQGGEAEPPLVDRIAELKMIRALQLRVNRRTKLIADTAAKTADPELLRTLQTLAEREDEVHRITRDIVLGKNK